jgi:hypothetical protein
METEIITKEYKKKADLKTRAGQLFVAQKQGLTDKEAAEKIGLDPRNVPQAEKTRTYQACIKKFGDFLQDEITLSEMGKELVKNIKQDQDKGAKNNAIKMAKEYIEPETEQKETSVVNVVIKKGEENGQIQGKETKTSDLNAF